MNIYIWSLCLSSKYKTKKKPHAHTIEYTQINTHVSRLNLKELYIHKLSKTLSFSLFYLSTLQTMNYVYIYMYIYMCTDLCI